MSPLSSTTNVSTRVSLSVRYPRLRRLPPTILQVCLETLEAQSPDLINYRVMISPEKVRKEVVSVSSSSSTTTTTSLQFQRHPRLPQVAPSNDIFFIESPAPATSPIKHCRAPTLLLSKQASIEKYCDQVVGRNIVQALLSQPPPQCATLLNDLEAAQVEKAVDEATADKKNAAIAVKAFNVDVLSVIEREAVYADVKCLAVQEKVSLMLKKHFIPQQMRRSIWPKVMGGGGGGARQAVLPCCLTSFFDNSS